MKHKLKENDIMNKAEEVEEAIKRKNKIKIPIVIPFQKSAPKFAKKTHTQNFKIFMQMKTEKNKTKKKRRRRMYLQLTLGCAMLTQEKALYSGPSPIPNWQASL